MFGLYTQNAVIKGWGSAPLWAFLGCPCTPQVVPEESPQEIFCEDEVKAAGAQLSEV
jgi:hypothetical protein